MGFFVCVKDGTDSMLDLLFDSNIGSGITLGTYAVDILYCTVV